MKKIFAAIFFLVPLICASQTDVLILQKHGRNMKTYAEGQYIIVKTVYDQWLEGTLTALRNDSIFINNMPFHVNEIVAVRQDFQKWNYVTDGTLLMVAGAGVIALNVINGIYTGESAGQWMKPSGWITAGALFLTGFLLKRARYKNYPIGKKYTLHYLNMHMEHPGVENQPLKKTEPPN